VELFAPELVTVTPLTRGTGNHNGPTVSSDGLKGSSNRPIVIEVHNILDGREIRRFVKKRVLSDVGLQV
jgi:hypothetical protein